MWRSGVVAERGAAEEEEEEARRREAAMIQQVCCTCAARGADTRGGWHAQGIEGDRWSNRPLLGGRGEGGGTRQTSA